MTNPYLSSATAAGTASDVAVEWDRGNDQWWDWYMSLADSPAPVGPLVDVAEADPGPLPSDDEVAAELAVPYPVTDTQVASFRAESFVKLPGVLTPGALARLRARLREMLDDVVDPSVGFQSLEMMWLDDALVRSAVLSPRIGGISAALLGAERVRLYHDNALSKEPGAGRTPWHYDAHHFPLDSPSVLTAWIPLQATPVEMGPLAFARGAETWKLVADVAFDKHGTSYDRGVSDAFRRDGVQVEDRPFAAGEMSFHSANCFHTAGANRTTSPRMVLATTYFADGVRVIPAPTMVSGDWRTFIPGAEPGAVVASARNPILAPPTP
ncbi:phytanoyl-CoA dioxygenase family protein [Pseudonocardia sp. 73-21]|uniref:phytanoyl-CoA dioxygenase family protein n=1 Tax=Pseudonocardia sp. 73-21 TaxID=1895809 RepID=UPI0009603E12|nr:phytanoyl-CoA dioxygenase family protein [Pseudonocardia sp. 73-21]OJY45919.1 MAG: snoK [Pseudonocardia sp. 73-21]